LTGHTKTHTEPPSPRFNATREHSQRNANSQHNTPINRSQIRTATSSKSSHRIPSSGPPIRRLPSLKSPTKGPLPTEKKRGEQVKEIAPKKQARSGYAVGLHSNAAEKLNMLLQQDIDALDDAIFSLLSKHELNLRREIDVTSTIDTPKITVDTGKEVNDKKVLPSKSPTEHSVPVYKEKEVNDKEVLPRKELPLKSPVEPLVNSTTKKSFFHRTPKLTVITTKPREQLDIPESPLIPITKEHHPIPQDKSSHYQPLSSSRDTIPEHADSSNTTACKFCSRTFNPDRLPAHEKVCQKTIKSSKTRERIRGVKENIKEKDELMNKKIRARENVGKVARPKVDWRKAHGTFSLVYLI